MAEEKIKPSVKQTDNKNFDAVQYLNNLKEELDLDKNGEIRGSEELKKLEEKINKLMNSNELNALQKKQINTSMMGLKELITVGTDSEKIKKEIDIIIDSLKNLSESSVSITYELIKGKKLSELNNKEKNAVSLSANIILDNKKLFEKNKFVTLQGDNAESITRNLNITTQEDKEIIVIFIQQQLEKISDEEKKKPLYLEKQNQKFFIISEKKYLERSKNEIEKSEYDDESSKETKNNQFPQWVSSNQELKTKLSNTSINQETYDSDVEDAKGPIFNFFDRLLGGLLTSLVKGNSLWGNLLRKMTGIPEPKKQLSPISNSKNGGLKQKYLGIKNRESIKEIVRNIKHPKKILPPQSNLGDNNSDKAQKIALSLNSAFPTAKIIGRLSPMEETSTHRLIISPSSEKDFTRIYGFLKSPVDNHLDEIQKRLQESTDTFPGGIGEKISQGVNSFTNMAKGNSIDIKGGWVNFIASPSKLIENGHKDFSTAKNEIKFPGDLDIKTRANGDIVVEWNESNSEKKTTKKEEKDAKPQPEKKK